VRILLFPEGYDPVIGGSLFEDLPEKEKELYKGFGWTKEEHEAMLELEKKAVIIECEKPPVRRWHLRVEDGDEKIDINEALRKG